MAMNQQNYSMQAITNPENVQKKSKYSESAQNSTIFSEFKEQYDEVRIKYEKLKIDYDELNREKKRIEIKFLNTNPEYYEREIKRLRDELQKYMEENEDNKYNYLKAVNEQKQLQSSLKVKEVEVKKLLKDLEKEKVNNVELRHQVSEKQKLFTRIKGQFERSNKDFSQNYENMVDKNTKLEQNLKNKTADLDSLTLKYKQIEREHHELIRENKRYKLVMEERLKKLNNQLEEQRINQGKQKTENSERMRQLSEEIQKFKQQRVSVDLLASRKKDQVNLIRDTRQLELDIVRLEEKNKDLKFEIQKKDQTIRELNKTIDKLKCDSEVSELQKIISDLRQEKTILIIDCERQIAEKDRQLAYVKLQSQNSVQRNISYSGKQQFHEILKDQIEENGKLKKQLSMKIDEVYNLKQDIDDLKIQKDNLHSQIDILKRQLKSAQKNSKIQIQVAGQNIKNQMETYKRKSQVLESKLNSKIKEVKEKDSFIMNSIVGRSRQEDVPIIMADLQRIFEAGYVQKLAEANQRIQELKEAGKHK